MVEFSKNQMILSQIGFETTRLQINMMKNDRNSKNVRWI